MKIKVHLRPIAMSMALEQFDKYAASDALVISVLQRTFPGIFGIFKLFRKYGGAGLEARRIDIKRSDAERFALLRAYFFNRAPGYLLQHKDLPPVDGKGALAEIALDIFLALVEGKGRPFAAEDPIIAFETNEVEKTGRERCVGSSDPYAIELAASELKISKRTAEKAVALGRDAKETIEAAKKAIPPGADVLFALVDYESKTVVLVADKPGTKTR